MRLSNTQRHLSNILFDGMLLEEAAITSYCEATLLEKPAIDTADYVAPVRTWSFIRRLVGGREGGGGLL